MNDAAKLVARIESWTPEEYRAAKGYLSRGAILDFVESSRVYHGRRIDGSVPDKETTGPMAFGDLAHLATLQTIRFGSEVACRPPMDKRRTKGLDADGCFTREGPHGPEVVMGKAAAEHWEAAHEGKRIVSADDHRRALSVAAAVYGHPVASRLIIGPTEVPVTWGYAITSGQVVPCKALMDARPHPGTVVDLKITGDPSPDGFRRASIRGRLHIQDAWYTLAEAALLGCPWHEVPPMVFLVVRDQPPHEVALYTLGFAERCAGMSIVESAVQQIVARQRSDDWHNPWERTPNGQPVALTWPEYALANPLESADV